MSEYSVFTSESVSEGHPDKMADQISDAVLDAIIKDDPNARVAVETLVKTGMAIVAGEVRTSTYVDLEDLIRQVILDIGYNSSDVGFDGASCAVLNAIGKQSADIAMGVDEANNKDMADPQFKDYDMMGKEGTAPVLVNGKTLAEMSLLNAQIGFKLEVVNDAMKKESKTGMDV